MPRKVCSSAQRLSISSPRIVTGCGSAAVLADADGLAVPFGLEQIDVTSKLEAAVDLFAAEPERFVGGQTECVEQAPEETLQVALNPSRRGLVRAVVSQVPGRIDLSYLGPDDLSAA